jgi:hypothetical protein
MRSHGRLFVALVVFALTVGTGAGVAASGASGKAASISFLVVYSGKGDYRSDLSLACQDGAIGFFASEKSKPAWDGVPYQISVPAKG